MRCKLWMFLLVGITFPAYGNNKGYKVVKEAIDRDEGFVDNEVSAKMVLKDRNGSSTSRKLSIKTLEGRGGKDKTIIIFKSPADVRGTALLTHTHPRDDNKQWLYLPAVKRVKRISSSNQSGPFVGSEFSYEDMVTHVLDKYSYKYLRMEKCGKMKCHVVEEYPKEKGSGYSKQVVWLDTQHYRLQKTEFYDRKKSKLKTLTITGYKKYAGKHWRPGKSVMKNLQTGKSTEIHWAKYSFKTGLKSSDFSKTALKRAR